MGIEYDPSKTPQEMIDNSDTGVNAFMSLNAMFDSYHEMLAMASRLLKSGILVFKTAGFVVRNSEESRFSGQWATNHAMEVYRQRKEE